MDLRRSGDISTLDHLNVDAVLSVLQTRYKEDWIYTNCGDANIAINPFRPLPIYSDEWHSKYDRGHQSKNQPPHIFQIAQIAFVRMLESSTNQVVLVSGESGAGKTESTKYMLKHIIYMCKNQLSHLHDQIIMMNPLLEAFGNAQTTMNKNSSRFGKYTEVSFDNTGRVVGAVIRDYMLEKSRVVFQCSGEGNFHIFYSLFAGLSDELKMKYKLSNAADYRILAQTDPNLIKEVSRFDENYKECMQILRSLEFTEDDISNIITILASVLHLTNVEFEPEEPQGVYVKDDYLLELVSNLLSLDVQALAKAMIAKTMFVAGEKFDALKNMDQANDGRDALAKALYQRLFGWIIRKINETLSPIAKRSEICTSLGVLDISGFENLSTNSFEQLCINIINERLQSFLNNHIFECEKQIYESEKIDWTVVDFKNNDVILDLLINGPRNMLKIINEESRLPNSTDKSLVQKMNILYQDNPNYQKTKGDHGQFEISHFAGHVMYDSATFLEKNRDNLGKDLLTCMKNSTSDFISDLFTVKRGPTGTISMTPFNYRKSRRSIFKMTPLVHIHNLTKSISATVRQSMTTRSKGKNAEAKQAPFSNSQTTMASHLLGSLNDLLQKISSAEPLFVRCIKPNSKGKQKDFDAEMVRCQLIYSGVAEMATARKRGFFYRKTYGEFLSRYALLLPTGGGKSEKNQISELLGMFGKEGADYQLGINKVFIKQTLHGNLEKYFHLRKLISAKIIQKAFRMHKKKKKQKHVTMKSDLETIIEIPNTSEEKMFHNISSKYYPKKNTVYFGNMKDSFTTKLHGVSLNYSNNYSKLPHAALFDTEETTPKRRESTTSQISLEDVQGGLGMYSEINSTDDDDDDNDDCFEGTEDQNENSNIMWDRFQNYSREKEVSEIQTTLTFKVLRVVMYMFLFLFVLTTSTVQKLSLITLVKKDSSVALTLIAVCIPYGVSLLINTFKFLFGKFSFPPFFTIFTVLVLETLHSAGLCLLVFWVFPKLKMLSVIMMMNASGFIPAVCRMLFVNIKSTDLSPCGNTKVTNGVCKTIDILSFFFQLSPVVLFPIGVFDSESDVNKPLAVFAFLLVSFGYWENFCDGIPMKVYGRKFRNALLSLKFHLQTYRYGMAMITSVWKIGLTILFAYLSGFNGKLKFSVSSQREFKTSDLPLFILLICCTFVGQQCAYMACKICMQRLSFSVPLFLSSILAALLAGLLPCKENFTALDGFQPLKDFFSNVGQCHSTDGSEIIKYVKVIFGISWFLSLHWICRSVWLPHQTRMENNETLFVNCCCCSVLFDQSLLFSYRRHRKKIYCKVTDSGETIKIDYFMEDEESSNVKKKETSSVPTVYACSTMWHETGNEMLQFLKTIFRTSKENDLWKSLEQITETKTNYYNFEAHIFFDDAIEENAKNEKVPNRYVKDLVSVINLACSSVYKEPVDIGDPLKVLTPYGGQLIWEMPGGSPLYVHLKDKTKIRCKKRWSQVMYMYYLFGFKLLEDCQSNFSEAVKGDILAKLDMWSSEEKPLNFYHMFKTEMKLKAENVFVLALDGDVEFSPKSVLLLLDRLRTNEKIAAACGRVHPSGTGPMVWFQIFEYAIGHWLQKATEHVLGCVLCSPGCFTLFRASALMDDNVMKKYASLATNPGEHLQYDQGEDRWLCTLLLQQGYRVDYSAAADATTHAPETFKEYFNQRRRWIPSTMANLLDLISNYKNTVKVNDNISHLYILYQFILMISTMLGPSTVMMIIASAISKVFTLQITLSYLLIIIPTAIFFVICLKLNSAIQLSAAVFLSVVYAFIMMIVLVGAIIIGINNGVLNPEVLFIILLSILFFTTSIFHPYEWTCLFSGFLYFICIPSGYLLLVIYAFCNLHVVSWGTREVDVRTKDKIEENKPKGFFARLLPVEELKDLFRSWHGSPSDTSKTEIMEALHSIKENISELSQQLTDRRRKSGVSVSRRGQSVVTNSRPGRTAPRDDEETALPNWIQDESLGTGDIVTQRTEERIFWKELKQKYLFPIVPCKKEDEIKAADLKSLRNNICFAIAVVNMLWLATNFMFQLKKPTTIEIPAFGSGENSEVELLGLSFIICFASIFVVQFLAMLIHRWETFLHLLSVTKLKNPFASRDDEGINIHDQFTILNRLKLEPVPDYHSSSTKFYEPVPDYDFIKQSTTVKNFQKKAEEYLSTVVKKDIRNTIKDMGTVLHTTQKIQTHRLNEASNCRYQEMNDGIDALNDSWCFRIRDTLQIRNNTPFRKHGFIDNIDQETAFNKWLRTTTSQNERRQALRSLRESSTTNNAGSRQIYQNIEVESTEF